MMNERGEGIITGLVAAAILGIVVLIVATLYQIGSRAMIKSSTLREIDNLQKRAQQILGNRTYCANSLVGTVWNGQNRRDIARLREAGTTIAQVGMLINDGRVRVSALYIRPRDVNQDSLINDINPGITSPINGNNFRAFVGEVVIEYVGVANGIGAIRPSIIPVVVVVNSVNNIRFCDINSEATINKVCNVATAIADGSSVASCTVPASPDGCRVRVNVALIDASGEPRCRCKVVCPEPVWFNYSFSGKCAPAGAVRSCPAGAENYPPYIKCPKFVGSYCYIPVPGGACGGLYPNRVFRMVCN